ncbi:hypothetical protein MKW92_009649 [Papaver armeniacum]|nr:hypothetical protein MKW92_009649 [Papaver armeniacum]
MKDKEGKLSVEMKNKHGNEILHTKNKVSGGVAYVDPPSRPKRKANDGFTIYSETFSSGIANSDAGGTRLCHFDCSCCF